MKRTASWPHLLILLSLWFSLLLFPATVRGSGSIVFSTVGRSLYGFDIFSCSMFSSSPLSELRLTDGVSINYNGFFPSSPSSLLRLLSPSSQSSAAADAVIYVSERGGRSAIYVDFFPSPSLRREAQARLRFPLLPAYPVSMKDRPSLSGDHLIFISTHEPSSSPRQSWAAVYSAHLPSGSVARLTPPEISDFSPSVSPSGLWTAVASSRKRPWSGEVQELSTGIYVFATASGSNRTLIVERGGWPCWEDDSTLYFHRRSSSDGWWGVYRASIGIQSGRPILIATRRLTPPGLHAFTPAVSPNAPNLVAVATRRSSSEFRHIELLDLRQGRRSFTEVTRLIAPHAHHYNPFFSLDGSRIGYHRCRGGGVPPPLFLESIQSGPEAFSLFRINGNFPSFSPDGRRVAYAKLPGLYVVDSDGSNTREVLSGNAFATAWDWKRRGVLYASQGPTFAKESARVDIVSITLREEKEDAIVKKLTHGGQNNAFPSPSPDGKWVVFRSGRSGHKNLYVMDAVEGESVGIYRLTEGRWSDTMCNWSPDGEWIAFASDRENPGSGSFAIYMVHPNGTGLRRVVGSGKGGRANHPYFSPDSNNLVFTSDYAGVSAEPIATPHQFQPYGDIFTVRINGSDIKRLTHNAYEDGTPTWTSFSLDPSDVADYSTYARWCSFDDGRWLAFSNATICSPVSSLCANAGPQPHKTSANLRSSSSY